MLDNLPNRVNHVVCACLLPLLAVDFGPVRDLLWIWDHAWASNTWPQGAKLVEGFGVAELAARYVGGELVVACRDVVGDGVAENYVREIGGGHVFAVAPDDDGQLTFVVEHALAGGVDRDAVQRSGERVAGLGEYGWVFWDLELDIC